MSEQKTATESIKSTPKKSDGDDKSSDFSSSKEDTNEKKEMPVIESKDPESKVETKKSSHNELRDFQRKHFCRNFIFMTSVQITSLFNFHLLSYLTNHFLPLIHISEPTRPY